MGKMDEIIPDSSMEMAMDLNPKPPDLWVGPEKEVLTEKLNEAEAHGTLSFRDVVAGKAQEEEMTGEEIDIGVEEFTVDKLGETLSFSLSERAKEMLGVPWKQTLVVKLLGRSIGFNALSSRLQMLWKPSGKLQIIDLENDYYLVKCELKRDFDMALMNGPWVILGHYLTVQTWTHEFRVSQSICSRVAVWLRLSNLPLQYYNETFLTMVGNQLVSTLKIDVNTKTMQRGRFARLAVEIDLVKPLTVSFIIDGEEQRVEYESLPCVCFLCGRIGHVTEGCQEKVVQSETQNPNGESESRMNIDKEAISGSINVEGGKFGPWIHVQKRNRKQINDKRGGKEVKSGGLLRQQKEEFSFRVLNDSMEDDEGIQVAKSREMRVNPAVVNRNEKMKGKETVKAVVEKKNKQKELWVSVSTSNEKEQSSRREKQQDISAVNKAQTTLNKEGGLGGYEQNFPELMRVFQQSGEGDIGMHSDEGGQAVVQGGKIFKGTRSFDWGLPRKPPNATRKVNRKGKAQCDNNGKRALSPSMEDLVKKSVRIRQKEEAETSNLEEEEIVSLVESTYQEETDENLQ